MKIKQLRDNSSDELRAQIQEAEKEMLGIKVKKAGADGSTQPLKIRTIRRDVARMHTVIREREIKKGVYNQANLDLDVIRTIPEVKYTLIDEMFDERLVKTLYELIEFADIPTGSLDLFVTGDGQYGLFEWSTQYAFMGANNHFIRQLLLDGIAKVIRNLNKK